MKKFLQTLKKDWQSILFLVACLGLEVVYNKFIAGPPEPGESMKAIVGLGMAAIGLGQAIAGGVKARKAKREAEKLEKNRPKYEMPQEVLDNQARAKSLAQGYDQQRATGERALTAQTATAFGQAQQQGGSATSQLAALASINQNRNRAQLGLEQQSAQNQVGKENRLSQANTAVANARDEEFGYNVNAPYQNALKKANMNQAAGTKSMWNGIQGLASAATGLATSSGGGIGKGLGGKLGSIFKKSELNANPYNSTGSVLTSSPGAASGSMDWSTAAGNGRTYDFLPK